MDRNGKEADHMFSMSWKPKPNDSREKSFRFQAWLSEQALSDKHAKKLGRGQQIDLSDLRRQFGASDAFTASRREVSRNCFAGTHLDVA